MRRSGHRFSASRDITAIKQAYDALRLARDQALEANL
jgi:hypothetical protein